MKNIRIRMKGLMDRDWEEWFTGFSLDHTQAGESILHGRISGQAELRGLVTRIADLGIEIISIETIPISELEAQRADGTAAGSGQKGTPQQPPHGRKNETHKEGTMKKKLHIIPVALVLVFTSVITGVVYSRSGDAERADAELQPRVAPTSVDVEARIDFGLDKITVEQIKGLYGLAVPSAGPASVPLDVNQIKAVYGYTEEPRAAEAPDGFIPAPLTVEQTKALYGHVEEPGAAAAPPSFVPAPLTIEQIKALYGIVEGSPAPRAVEVTVSPAAGPLSPVDQLKALYGWTDDPPTVRETETSVPAPLTVDQIKVLYGWTDDPPAAGETAAPVPAPLTVDQIKALYGWTDEPQAPQAASQNAGPATWTVEHLKALYGYVEGPELNIWDLEIVPPIYTYPWYIRP